MIADSNVNDAGERAYFHKCKYCFCRCAFEKQKQIDKFRNKSVYLNWIHLKPVGIPIYANTNARANNSLKKKRDNHKKEWKICLTIKNAYVLWSCWFIEAYTFRTWTSPSVERFLFITSLQYRAEFVYIDSL